MNRRCKYLKIVKNGEDGSRAAWNCYKQYEERFLVQSCYLKRGECRYSNGPFPPEAEEAGEKGAAKAAMPQGQTFAEKRDPAVLEDPAKPLGPRND